MASTSAALIDAQAFLRSPNADVLIAEVLANPDLCAHNLQDFPELVFRTCPTTYLRKRLGDDEEFRWRSATLDFAFHRQDVITGMRALAAHWVADWSRLEDHTEMLQAHEFLLAHAKDVTLPLAGEYGPDDYRAHDALDALLERRLVGIWDDEVWTPDEMQARFDHLEAQIELFRWQKTKVS
jgi:hypothetical protein